MHTLSEIFISRCVFLCIKDRSLVIDKLRSSDKDGKIKRGINRGMVLKKLIIRNLELSKRIYKNNYDIKKIRITISL